MSARRAPPVRKEIPARRVRLARLAQRLPLPLEPLRRSYLARPPRSPTLAQARQQCSISGFRKAQMALLARREIRLRQLLAHLSPYLP